MNAATMIPAIDVKYDAFPRSRAVLVVCGSRSSLRRVKTANTAVHYSQTTHARIFATSSTQKQEAQLPQRNSASAAHMEGELSPPAHSPPPTVATPMRMVESETNNKRTSSVPSVKRTLS